MPDSTETTLPPSGARILPGAPSYTVRWRNFLGAIIALVAVYSLNLYALVRFALQSDLYSHVILVPFVSLYLVWLKRDALLPHSPPDYKWAVPPVMAGLVLLALRFTVASLGNQDALALATLSFVALLVGICALFLGRPALRALAFPIGFLVFMAPFPTPVMHGIEAALQNWSADTAHLFIKLSGTPVFRQETFFQLPGMKIYVAPECSGIHSTLALFLTSLLAGYFFLRSPGKRALLALAIIPLALLRNGLRIFVISELCVHIGPEMIDSYIHRHGGPIFFTLSLLPFSWGLWLLVKSDRRSPSPPSPLP